MHDLSMEHPRRQELEGSGQKAHPLTLAQVDFTDQAHVTIGLAAQEVATELGVPVTTLTGRLGGEMYWLEPSGALMLVLDLPARDNGAAATMFVEIPAEHWRARASGWPARGAAGDASLHLS